MTTNYKLVSKGSRVPLAGLLDQGRVHLRLAEVHGDVLMKKGWKLAYTYRMQELIELVEAVRAKSLDARTGSKANLRREQEAVKAAKAFKADIVMAFGDLHLDGILDAHVSRAVRTTGARLKRSTPLISKYLNDIRCRVEAWDCALRPYFGGESALCLLDAVKAELDQAQMTQEADYAALPLETLKVYEAKGELLSLIEKLNRIAKRAFSEQPEIAARFDKELIERARKSRGSRSTVEPLVVDEAPLASSDD